MGLGIDAVEAIFREHRYRPIDGDALLIGRQTVYFTPSDILALLRGLGIESRLPLDKIEIDRDTLNRKTGTDKNAKLISDRSLFHMLGVRSVRALDHSDYEGAEVVHDLTQPLPESLREIADFIVDGSTLDKTFSPALTIRNYAELLRPRGRILMLNMLSNDHEPYAIQPPLWYLDYFTVNKFVDCKVYILVFPPGGSNAFCVNLAWLMNPDHHVSSFTSPHEMAILVFAEKGPDSTTHLSPAQQHYRSASDWKTYRQNLATIQDNPRPHLACSRSPISFLDVRGGHLFMTADFEALDPTMAAKALARKSA